MALKPLTAIPGKADILETAEQIRGLIHKTPVMTSATLDAMAGGSLFFKCENFQKIGAFKMRGAASAGLRVATADRLKGLATHSSGNHAQAVARTAQMLGCPAYIVMPANAPAIKKSGTAGYGAQIIECTPTQEAREKSLEDVVRNTGAHFIHPYNNYDVIAGQATAALELIEEIGDLDIVMAPVGGGGLLSGTALSCRYFLPSCKVIGAEPEKVNDAFRSFHSGRIEENASTDTIADGLRTTLGDKTLGIIRDKVDDILTVPETAIVEAMRIIWERMKIIIEPSCAVPYAVVRTYPEYFAGKRTGIILTGGNVDLSNLPFR